MGEYLRAAALSSCWRNCCDCLCCCVGRAIFRRGLYASSMGTSPSPSLYSGPRVAVAPGDCRGIEFCRDGVVYGSGLICEDTLASLEACGEEAMLCEYRLPGASEYAVHCGSIAAGDCEC
jgi:hypothetical protein